MMIESENFFEGKFYLFLNYKSVQYELFNNQSGSLKMSSFLIKKFTNSELRKMMNIR